MESLHPSKRPSLHYQNLWLEKYQTEKPVLLEFQKKWVLDDSPLKVVEKGRQLGFTWCEALWSVRRRLTYRLDHYFSSADWLTAKNFIKDCKTWAEALNILVDHEFIKIEDATAESLHFPNGSRIVAISSSPKALRGKRGDITLDELAFSEGDQDLLAAAIPCTTWGGCLHAISTHNGPATAFYQIVEGAKQKKNDYSLHRVTLEDALRDGLALKIPGKHLNFLPDLEKVNAAYFTSCRTKCLNEEIFQQEYMCQPLSASTLILPSEYDAVLELCHELSDIPDSFDFNGNYGELYVGVDVGRAKAVTVIWVLERGYDMSPETPESMRNVYRTVCVIPMANSDITNQYQVLSQILDHPRVAGCIIDMGAIGRALSDLALTHPEAGSVVEPLAVTGPVKARCAERVKHFIQTRRVTIPREPLLREDILSVRRMVSKTKQLTYDGQSSLGHGDAFWGLAFALEAAEKNEILSVQVFESENKRKALPAA